MARTWAFDKPGWWRFVDGEKVLGYVARAGNTWQAYAADRVTKIDKPVDFMHEARELLVKYAVRH
jgi:hypothetical protein